MEIKKPSSTRRVTLPKLRIGVAKDREFLSENMSALVSSGMPVAEALCSIRADVSSRAMRRIISYLVQEVENGRPLWEALAEAKIFDSYVVSLVRIGENSGSLAQNLSVVAKQEQKRRVFAAKLKTALMYPVFVLSVTVVVGVLVAWFILPRLASVFAQLGIALPVITQKLINIGLFLRNYGDIVMPAFLLAFAVCMYLLFFFRPTRGIGHWLLFHIPGIRGLIQEIELARMGYLLGSQLSAGVPIVDALNALEGATSFYFYRRLYRHLRISTNEGHALGDGLKSYRGVGALLPTPIQQLIASSEQSGSLPEAFVKIGELYESKADDTTKSLTVVLEPLLLVIVWLGVVAVALAVVLPIYSLVGNFNDVR